MAKEFKIQTRFTGIDQLSRTTKAIAKNFGGVTRAAKATNRAISNTGKLLSRMGQRSAVASATASIAIVGMISRISDFSDALNELESVALTATTQQLAEMKSQAKLLGSQTKFTASEVTRAQTAMARSGFAVNEILASTPSVLNLATAANIEIAESSKIVSDTLRQFKLDASQAGKAADILSIASSTTSVTVSEIAQSLSKAAPISRKFGLSLEETTAAIGLLGNVGVRTELAGTALKTLLISLAAPAGKAAKSLQALGVDTNKPQKFSNILKQIGNQINGLSKSKQIEVITGIFGREAVTGGLELIDQAQLNNVKKTVQSFSDLEGTIDRMAKIRMQGPFGAIVRFQSAVDGLILSMGESGLTGQFTKITNKLTAFVTSLGAAETETLANITAILVFLAVLAPVFFAMGSIISAIGVLVPGLIWLGGVIAAVIIPLIKKLILDFTLLALVNPFSLIVLAVVAVIAIFTALIVYWDDIVAAFSVGIEKIIGFFQPLIDIISSIGDIGALFGKTVLGIGTEDNTEAETGERQSVPAQLAANQVSAQASANARVEFIGTPNSGVAVTGGSGEEIDPENGVTAAAGF